MVAREIASKEYNEYPKIEKKMKKAADAVESATNELQGSLKQLATVDRAVGWQSLNDACKIIAEKTTLLLQIVYGAEIKRLFDQSERALESIAASKAQFAVLQKNPQPFANSASLVATQAGTTVTRGIRGLST